MKNLQKNKNKNKLNNNNKQNNPAVWCILLSKCDPCDDLLLINMNSMR